MNDGIDQMRKAQEDRFFKLEQEKHLMAYVVRRGSRGVACSHNFDLDFFFWPRFPLAHQKSTVARSKIRSQKEDAHPPSSPDSSSQAH
jgi:hypothetical protein